MSNVDGAPNLFKLRKSLYHYTKSETVIKYILPSLTLRMGSFEHLNDPKEAKAWPFKFYSRAQSSNKKFQFKLFEDVSKYITQKSLVVCCSQDDPSVVDDHEDRPIRSGFGHPRMWAQYGDAHKGVCLMLDHKKLHETIISRLGTEGLYYGPIEYLSTTYGPRAGTEGPYELAYWEDIVESGVASVMEPHIKRFHKELLFTKHLDWQDEWEYRWVYRSDDGQPVLISVAESLKAVLLGSDCSVDDSRKIADLCTGLSLPVLRVYWHGWAVSIFEEPLNDKLKSETALSLNGISFSTQIPCNGIFAQAYDQYGKGRTILIENNGAVTLLE